MTIPVSHFTAVFLAALVYGLAGGFGLTFAAFSKDIALGRQIRREAEEKAKEPPPRRIRGEEEIRKLTGPAAVKELYDGLWIYWLGGYSPGWHAAAVQVRTAKILQEAAAILGERFPFGYLSDDGAGGARLEFDHESGREVIVRIFNEAEGDGPGDIFSKWGPVTRETPPTGENLAAELEWLKTGKREEAKEEAPAG